MSIESFWLSAVSGVLYALIEKTVGAEGNSHHHHFFKKRENPCFAAGEVTVAYIDSCSEANCWTTSDSRPSFNKRLVLCMASDGKLASRRARSCTVARRSL